MKDVPSLRPQTLKKIVKEAERRQTGSTVRNPFFKEAEHDFLKCSSAGFLTLFFIQKYMRTAGSDAAINEMRIAIAAAFLFFFNDSTVPLMRMPVHYMVLFKKSRGNVLL